MIVMILPGELTPTNPTPNNVNRNVPTIPPAIAAITNTGFIKIKEIIHILCELLRNAGYVDERFEKSVFERENKVSTVMDGVIAIPHPLEMCSLKSKIAIGILDAPIHWSGKDTAQIILMLGLSDESKKDIEKLYDTFVEMMHNPQLQSLLLKTENLNDFLQILKDHISLDNF
ncbi:PTS sugar transporter subunit IIA [Faecalicoccus pleomorphus]|uniref:PTS sugar transporter subunit IIA n=2 Tax=Faecalicoccus pleomorphus TaxID=1323 RepID=UPI002FE5FD78